MKSVIICALVAAVLGLVAMNWRLRRSVAQREEPEVVVRFPGYVETNKAVPDYRHVLVVKSNAVPAEAEQNKKSDWQCAEATAVPVLLKYYPEATEDQKHAVTEYMWRRDNWHKQWVKEAKEIKEHLAALNDPSVPESARIEIGRVHETEWKMMLATIKDVTETLDKSSVPFFEKHGLTDPNFQSDLRAVAYPAGKEHWEE